MGLSDGHIACWNHGVGLALANYGPPSALNAAAACVELGLYSPNRDLVADRSSPSGRSLPATGAQAILISPIGDPLFGRLSPWRGRRRAPRTAIPDRCKRTDKHHGAG
ncbi:MAG: hypothetical protein ACYCTF_04105 [Acidiferrobacter sp.]